MQRASRRAIPALRSLRFLLVLVIVVAQLPLQTTPVAAATRNSLQSSSLTVASRLPLVLAANDANTAPLTATRAVLTESVGQDAQPITQTATPSESELLDTIVVTADVSLDAVNIVTAVQQIEAGAPTEATTDTPFLSPTQAMMSSLSEPMPIDKFNGSLRVGAPEAWKLNLALGSVSLFRGSANYAFSIDGPASVDELKPVVPINHSSAAADMGSSSVLGRGWDMNLSKISRVYSLDSYVRWVPRYEFVSFGSWYWANSEGTQSLCDQYNTFFISDTVGPRCVAGDTNLACIARDAANGGGVACWGMNNRGQLGDGTFIDRAIPLTNSVEPALPANGVPLTVNVTRPGDTIRFAFDAVAGAQYALRMICPSATSPGPGYYLYTPDRTVLNAITYVPCIGSWSGPNIGPLAQAGRYVIEVRPTSYTTGVYTFSFAAQVVNAGTLIVDGASTVMTLPSPGQSGQITFTGMLGQWLNIGLNGSGAGSADVSVQQPSGAVFSSGYLGFNTTRDFDLAALPASGTYTVTLTPSSNGTGAYTFTLSSALTATALLNGASVSRTVTRAGQDVRVTVDASAGDRLNIGLVSINATTFADVEVLQPNGAIFASTSLFSWSPSDFDTAVLPVSGSYSMTVSTPATGTLSINGAAQPVTITRPAQDGWLTFNGVAGQAITLTTVAPSGRPTDLYVYTPSGAQLVSDYAYGTSNLKLPSLSSSGVYSVRIDPWSSYTGVYTLSLSAPPRSSVLVPRPEERGSGEVASGGAKVLAKVEQPAPAQQGGTAWQQLIAQLNSDAAQPGDRIEITKYYAFGGARVATRQAGNEVFYLAGDHLGSASVVVDWQGRKISEMR